MSRAAACKAIRETLGARWTVSTHDIEATI